ncbi:Os02g0109001 [Oryza sativa Japonica Group]|uniref:Os02g0109001 protein n=1 Tax=Oryza sativa subsp. japonica TaxID=39947 RepID=A0A0P0VDS6_ORYSJ|nr:Os02g0109001 [Oryza sativa Japonica Group]
MNLTSIVAKLSSKRQPWYSRKSTAPLLLAKHSSRTSSSTVNGGGISSGAADSTTLARSTAARHVHLAAPSSFDNDDDSGRLAALSSFDDNDRYLVAPRHGQAERPVRLRHEEHLHARLGDAFEVRGMREFDLRRRR